MKGSQLGLLQCVAMIVSGCIGSAIFSLSGLTMFYAGPACLVTWALAAVVQGIYGAEVSEMSIHYGESGGIYAFPARALGRLFGFLAAWGFVVANIIAISFSAIYIGTYLSVSFGVFEGLKVPLALLCVIACAFLNFANIGSMGKANAAFAALLAAMLLFYCVISFSHANFSFAGFSPFFMGAKGRLGFISAVPNALVAYGNVVCISFVAGNVRKPSKNIPLSLAFGLAAVSSLYLLTLCATLGHISYEYLQDNPAMRFIPLFAAAFSSMGDLSFLPAIISLSAVLALFTTVLVLCYVTAVALKGMADDGALFKGLARVNRNGSPFFSIAVVALLSCLLCLVPGVTEFLVNLGSLVSVIIMVIVISSFIAYRIKASGIRGRVFTSVALPSLLVAIMLACYLPSILSGGWQVWAFTVGTYALGALAFLATFRLRRS